jgi:hypothetical protein
MGAGHNANPNTLSTVLRCSRRKTRAGPEARGALVIEPSHDKRTLLLGCPSIHVPPPI